MRGGALQDNVTKGCRNVPPLRSTLNGGALNQVFERRIRIQHTFHESAGEGLIVELECGGGHGHHSIIQDLRIHPCVHSSQG